MCIRDRAETKTCRVADGVGTDIGVKGAIRTQEAGPGVSDENLDYLALGGGFKANALCRDGSTCGGATGGRLLAFDSLNSCLLYTSRCV